LLRIRQAAGKNSHRTTVALDAGTPNKWSI
jgi:hypothetical protein